MRRRAEIQAIADTLGGLPVWGCLPGSPAHRAGIGYGDILLEVNGVRTDGVQAYQRACEADVDRERRVRLMRDGREIALTLALDPPIAQRPPEAIEAALRHVAASGMLTPPECDADADSRFEA